MIYKSKLHKAIDTSRKYYYKQIKEIINKRVDKLNKPKDVALQKNDAARYAYYQSEQRGLKEALDIVGKILFDEDMRFFDGED